MDDDYNWLTRLLKMKGAKPILLTVLAAAATIITFQFLVDRDTTSDPKDEAVIPISFQDSLDAKALLSGVNIEYFDFSGKDSVFMTNDGTLLSVLPNSLLLNGSPYTGKAIMQYQEARRASDIVKAGLQTKSGDRLLETQGMFSLQFFSEKGEPLTIDSTKGVQVQIPVDEFKEGMQLFTGKKDSSGKLDWVNPKPIERAPRPIDIAWMDFYPPEYEKELDRLKWSKGREKRDSLYLSFDPGMLQTAVSKTEEKPDRTIGQATGTYREIMDMKNQKQDPFAYGKILFEAKCSSCHSLNKNSTGPDLAFKRNIWDRELDQKARSNGASIYSFVRDWQKTYQANPSKSGFLHMVISWSPVAKPNFPELSDKQIDAIFDYIDSKAAVESVSAASAEGELSESLIPPSLVLATWNKKFNGTILATMDFQERLPFIHKTCDERVFKKYVNQLNKKISEIDKEVVAMGYAEFEDFAKQQVGGIKVGDEHSENIRNYFEKAIRELVTKAKSDKEFRAKMERAWDKEVQISRNEEANRRMEREQQNLEEEFNHNMNNVAKQMGINLKAVVHGGGTVYNIDKYVMDATIARQTSTITDPVSGKTTQIYYDKMEFEISNEENFDKSLVYLFSKEIESYEREDLRGKAFGYNLNRSMSYDAAIIGINEEGYFIKTIQNAKGKDYGKVKLKQVSEQEFNEEIDALNQQRKKEVVSIKDELAWLTKEQKNYLEQKRRKEDAAFRSTIRLAIYPCKRAYLYINDREAIQM